MRNTVVFLSCLLASLWITIALADNGVERGSIEYSEEAQIPPSVRNYLEKLMFKNCDLKGAAVIRTVYALSQAEPFSQSNSTRRFMVEFQVSYKDASPVKSIYAEFLVTDSDASENHFELLEFQSPICRLK